ncbi:MAG: hypothetical protein PVI89_04870 [Desulfobacteraceae bacterium]
MFPAGGMAADFELFWDANCNEDPTLEGYYIYYLENASVVDNPNEATKIYLPVSDDGFDRIQPSHQISNLLDDVRYCFAITAWYGDEESDVSNEICGINGTHSPESDPDTESDPEPDTESDPDTDTDSNPEPDTGSDPEPDTESDPEPDTESDPETDTDSNPETDTDSNPETDTDSDPEPDTESDPETDTDSNPETDTDSDPETDTDSDPETDTDSDPETDTESDPETEPNTDDEGTMLIIDDGDDGSLSVGTWVVSGGADPYGTKSLYSKEVGATYTYKASLTGRHEIALWWTYYQSRCAEVLVEIHDGDELLNTVLVDQTQNGGQWNILGTYTFSDSAMVVVISDNANCSTCADAASFRPIASDPEPEADPEPDTDADQEPEPFPGINPNPGPGTNPGVTNLSGDGSSGGCFITNLK